MTRRDYSVTHTLHEGYGGQPKDRHYRNVPIIVASNRQTNAIRLGMAKRMQLEALNLRMRF